MNLNRHIDRVSQSIFIGSYEAIMDPEVLKEHSISKILSLDIEKPLVAQELKHLFICVSDEPDSDIISHLPLAMKFLADEGTTLVHCRHGVSRSATVVMAWLMRRERFSVDEAYRRLVSIRPSCEPNHGFMHQLHLFKRMNCTVDTVSKYYLNFALQHGNVICSLLNLVPGEIHYSCRKCRLPIATEGMILNHQSGKFPKWEDPDVKDKHCKQGLFIVPPIWLSEKNPFHWYKFNKLNCHRCKCKIGSWGMCSCACGASGRIGVLINLSTVDRRFV